MQLFKSKGEATIESNMLKIYEILYPQAVEAVATSLRARLESGELRGWRNEDEELPPRRLPPLFRLERECGRRYVTTPVRALGVLACSPSAQSKDREAWRWDLADGFPLRSAAVGAMAQDVLRLARARGWSPRASPRPKSVRHARHHRHGD